MAQTKIRSEQIEDTLSGKTINTEGFNTPTLLNNWVQYGDPFTDVRYIKDSQGIVHISGLMKLGDVPANCFVLPAGYRPNGTLIFQTICSNAGLSARIYVHANGDVYVRDGGGWTSLSGISFKADN